MQIILSKEEYERLRPNQLNSDLIEKFRMVLYSDSSTNMVRTVERLKAAFEDFKKDIERADEDDRFRLW